jgi:hypothetical protein
MSRFLSTLREPAIASQIVWRDHPGACSCNHDHPHFGDVTASHLADLVEAGNERAEDRLRSIVLMGVALAVVRAESEPPRRSPRGRATTQICSRDYKHASEVVIR